MKIPILAWILQGIPENIAILTLAFAISKTPLNIKKIFVLGSILALFSYILRLLPITFGIHTVLAMCFLCILLITIVKININMALISSLLSILAIIVSETICLSILMPLFNITPEKLFSNTSIRILITWPQIILLFIAAFLLYKIRNKKSKL